MAYEERYRQPEMPHNVIMENRTKLSVSGVEAVDNFDDTIIVVSTTQGTLVVRGVDLHLEKLSLDSGEVSISGNIDGMEYEDNKEPAAGFFARLFK